MTRRCPDCKGKLTPQERTYEFLCRICRKVWALKGDTLAPRDGS